MTNEPSAKEIAELTEEVKIRIDKAESMGFIASPESILRRMIQERGRHFDSAEWFLNHRGDDLPFPTKETVRKNDMPSSSALKNVE